MTRHTRRVFAEAYGAVLRDGWDKSCADHVAPGVERTDLGPAPETPHPASTTTVSSGLLAGLGKSSDAVTIVGYIVADSVKPG